MYWRPVCIEWQVDVCSTEVYMEDFLICRRLTHPKHVAIDMPCPVCRSTSSYRSAEVWSLYWARENQLCTGHLVVFWVVPQLYV